MQFFKYFCFICILYYVGTESNVSESMFEIMALDHSGLLIFWKPIENSEHHFFLDYQAIGKGKQNSNPVDLSSYPTNLVGQHIIPGLDENTEYVVTIKEYDNVTENADNSKLQNKSIKTYTLKGRTRMNMNSIPAKPDIEYVGNFTRNPIIKWIPCGKERDCHGKNSGTHFSAKVRLFQSRRTSIIYSEPGWEYLDLFIFAGRTYQVVLTSIHGEFQTDSDPQELFIMPFASSVRFVKILPLNESTVIISWKSPKESANPVEFYQLLLYQKLNDSKHDAPADIIFDCNKEVSRCPCKHTVYAVEHNAEVCSGLKPLSEYVLCIIPLATNLMGMEYLINYSHIPQTYDENLSVAMPEMSYAIRDRGGNKCFIQLQWLPCGKMFDCKNIRPGDSFISEYKEPGDKKYKTYKRTTTRINWTIQKNQRYNIKISSMRGSDSSASISKTFEIDDQCKEKETD